VTDNDLDSLASRFEHHRTHLRAIAHRMLGSRSDADDAVQEAWLRLGRADAAGIDNLGGWLTTVVARVCLDMLRSRRLRREQPIGPRVEEAATTAEASLADAIGPALLIVLETLAPAERLAFVLHDLFGVPFEAIATIVDRSPAAARQLASRARRRVHGASAEPDVDRDRQRAIVGAFLAASREGNFEALLAVLDPDVVVRADATAVGYGTQPEIRGAAEVIRSFAARARGARPALVDGVPGAVWMVGGAPRVVFDVTIEGGRITAIALIGEPARIAELDLEVA
jgi:RNA polymerase sigma-70 factor (ECF subfamily)